MQNTWPSQSLWSEEQVNLAIPFQFALKANASQSGLFRAPSFLKQIKILLSGHSLAERQVDWLCGRLVWHSPICLQPVSFQSRLWPRHHELCLTQPRTVAMGILVVWGTGRLTNLLMHYANGFCLIKAFVNCGTLVLTANSR